MKFGHLEGVQSNPILRGRNRSPWLQTTYKSWNDPPTGLVSRPLWPCLWFKLLQAMNCLLSQFLKPTVGMVERIQLGVSPKIMGKPPNHPFVHRVWNHYFHHPFWGTSIFGNTQLFSGQLWAVQVNWYLYTCFLTNIPWWIFTTTGLLTEEAATCGELGEIWSLHVQNEAIV